MDRNTNYSGQVPLETDLLKTNQFAMTAIAKLSAAILGMSTVTNGFVVSQSVVPAMSVLIQPGEIYSAQNLESTAYNSLPADLAHIVLKQGIALNSTTLAIAAPTTAGYSISYLVQATYQDSDTGSTVLPYYNASNPSVAFSGPNNSGAAQPTTRAGTVSLNAKAGIAATTGSQTAPSPDSGYIGLYVVVVAYGAASVVNANISAYIGASSLPASGVVAAVQASSLINAPDTGTANTYVCAYSPAITALTDGLVLWFKALTPNTGASTLKVNALAAAPLVGGAHAALQGGEIIATGKCMCVYNASLSAFVLLECTGGALQVASGTKPNHAAQVSQLPGFTPVQQGGGTGQGTNAIKIGLATAGGRLKAMVDASDFGNILFDSQFPSSLGTSGYQKLVTGLIIQWGTAYISDISNTSSIPVTFPISFPTSTPIVVASDDSTQLAYLVVTSRTGTGFTINATESNSNVASHYFPWMAIGY